MIAEPLRTSVWDVPITSSPASLTNVHFRSFGTLECIGAMHGTRFSTVWITGGSGFCGGGHLCPQPIEGAADKRRQSPRVVGEGANEVIVACLHGGELGLRRVGGGVG